MTSLLHIKVQMHLCLTACACGAATGREDHGEGNGGLRSAQHDFLGVDVLKCKDGIREGRYLSRERTRQERM